MGQESPQDVEQLALRHRDRQIRDGLAMLATSGQMTWDELRADVQRPTRLWRRRRRWRPERIASLARVVGLQQLDADDLEMAAALYDATGRWPLPHRHLLAQAQIHLALGRTDEVRKNHHRQADEQLHLAWLDAVNPYTTATPAEVWEQAFAKLWSDRGLAPAQVQAGSDRPFDRLSCGPLRTTASGPLVTVVMTTYNPGPELLTSVGSIVNQTWKNLEILLVDDASDPAGKEVLHQAAALDPRIQVLHLPRNGGTYLARNAGIAAAKGTIVTGQDDDDWSHPQRVERQVLPLLADPQLSATWSTMFRVTSDLNFQRLGFTSERVSPISLMFRRDLVQRLGGFAAARRSADSELVERLRAATGRGPMKIPYPLLLARMSPDSLSGGDFRPGWHHPARVAFRSTWRAWHKQISAGASPVPGRQVQIPRRYQIESPAAVHHDVVLVGDWRLDNGWVRAGLEIAAALQNAAVRTAIMQIDSRWVVVPGQSNLAPVVATAVNEGLALVVAGDPQVTVNQTVVLDPLVLDAAAADGLPPTQGVTVIASRPEPGLYDPKAAVVRAQQLFEAPVVWAAGSPETYLLLTQQQVQTPVAQPPIPRLFLTSLFPEPVLAAPSAVQTAALGRDLTTRFSEPTSTVDVHNGHSDDQRAQILDEWVGWIKTHLDAQQATGAR